MKAGRVVIGAGLMRWDWCLLGHECSIVHWSVSVVVVELVVEGCLWWGVACQILLMLKPTSCGTVFQLVRALVCQTRGLGFKPPFSQIFFAHLKLI